MKKRERKHKLNEQYLGLFLWLLLQRHDGLIHFTNKEIAAYPGMRKMRIATETLDDGINLFVVDIEGL